MDFDANISSAIVRIKVVGVGGGGNNVLLRLAEDHLPGIELLGINTDAKQLGTLQQAGIQTLQIGDRLTKGRGTGGNPLLAEQAAMSDERRIQLALRDADLVFVTAGMGGGVGTGSAPVIARCIRDMGILSIGVVTTPFAFEGRRKHRTAMEGIAKMQGLMDALVVVHNDNLLKLLSDRRLQLVESFQMADNVLRQAILCISEVILTTGVVNVDFADVTSVFRQSESSDAILGIGESETGSAVEAVQRAITSPLIDRPLEGARGIILNLTGDESLSLYEVSEATQYINTHTNPEVNIIFGTVIDKNSNGHVRATLVATDFVDSVIVRRPQLAPPTTPPPPPTQPVPEMPAGLPSFSSMHSTPLPKKSAALPSPDIKGAARKIPNVRPLPPLPGEEEMGTPDSASHKTGAEDLAVPDIFSRAKTGTIPPFRPFEK